MMLCGCKLHIYMLYLKDDLIYLQAMYIHMKLMLSAHFTYHQWHIQHMYIHYNIYIAIYIVLYIYVTKNQDHIPLHPSLSTGKHTVNSHDTETFHSNQHQVQKTTWFWMVKYYSRKQNIAKINKKKHTKRSPKMKVCFLLKIFRFGFLPANYIYIYIYIHIAW